LLQRSYTLVVGALQLSSMMGPINEGIIPPQNGAATMYVTDPKLEPADPAAEASRGQTGMSLPVLTAMNSLNLGILIVDHECRITFANDYATQLLRSLKGTPIRNPRSAGRDASPFNKRLREAISDGDHRADSFLALNGAGTNSLVVQIVPYRSPGQTGVSGSILFVSDINTKPDLDLGPAAKLYGLTPAELCLLEALLRGEKIGSYAQKWCVTQNTVKGHLAQLFRKTQTCRQSELVLRVLANPVFRLASRYSSAHPTAQGSSV
jgi:DNA-binding CsgD family transcriptional regulator